MLRRFLGISLCALTALFAASTASADIVVVDDFSSGDLSAYTQTVLLDVNDGANNGTVFSTVGGALSVDTTGFDAIEQTAFTLNTFGGLGIGETLLLDVDDNGNQDIGLYVGNATPVTDVREDYIISFARNQSQGLNSIFDAANPGGVTTGFGPQGALAGVFIRRTGDDDFEAGYFDAAGTEFIEGTYTDTGINGSIIGIYTDIRANGALGTVDNLRVHTVPEPSSFALLGLAAVVGFGRRRKS